MVDLFPTSIELAEVWGVPKPNKSRAKPRLKTKSVIKSALWTTYAYIITLFKTVTRSSHQLCKHHVVGMRVK